MRLSKKWLPLVYRRDNEDQNFGWSSEKNGVKEIVAEKIAEWNIFPFIHGVLNNS